MVFHRQSRTVNKSSAKHAVRQIRDKFWYTLDHHHCIGRANWASYTQTNKLL